MEDNIKNMNYNEICKMILDIYNKNKQCEFKYLEQLFIRFTELLFMKIFNVDKEPVVIIVDSDEYKGSYDGYKTININRHLLKQFQEGKALELFETISHEFNHFNQKRSYENINIKNAIIEKDKYLSEQINGYKDINYDFLAVEVDAFLAQGNDAQIILASLGITPSDEEKAYSNYRKEQYQKQGIVTERIINNEVMGLDDIFEELFLNNTSNMDEFDRNNFLEFNPCTNLEYKVFDNKFARKNSNEIEQTYNDWLNGVIELKGNRDEIDNYFKYVLSNAKKMQNSII